MRPSSATLELVARPGGPRSGCVALASAAAAGAVGCTSYSTLEAGPAAPDRLASAEAAYEFEDIDTFDSTNRRPNFFTAPTTPPTPSSTCRWSTPDRRRAVRQHDRAGTCVSFRQRRLGIADRILQLRSSGTSPPTKGCRSGRARPATPTRSFTVVVRRHQHRTPRRQVTSTAACTPPSTQLRRCTGLLASTGDPHRRGPTSDPATGTVVGGATTRRRPQRVRQQFGTVWQVTSQLAILHVAVRRVPSGAQPNRVPNADLTDVRDRSGTRLLLTSALMNLVFRLPSGGGHQPLDRQHLGFYRPRWSRQRRRGRRARDAMKADGEPVYPQTSRCWGHGIGRRRVTYGPN